MHAIYTYIHCSYIHYNIYRYNTYYFLISLHGYQSCKIKKTLTFKSYIHYNLLHSYLSFSVLRGVGGKGSCGCLGVGKYVVVEDVCRKKE